jgi:dihydrolipoamide dehydrogenase
MQQAVGLVKVIADAEHDDLLGLHIVGPVAGELEAEAVLALEIQATAEDIQRTMQAHPTLSEALHEAALAADKLALHGLTRYRSAPATAMIGGGGCCSALGVQ